MTDTENVVTFRCSDALLEEIDAAVDASRFENRAPFLRWHLEETIGEPYTSASGTNRNALAERIAELETRLSDVEQQLQPDRSESNRTESHRIGADELGPARGDASRERSHGSERDAVRDDETASVYRDALEGWSPGQGPSDREKRREIGVTALQWLADQSHPVSRSDVVTALYDRTALEGQGSDAWWRRLVRPALSTAGENGFVDDSGRTYEWVHNDT